MSSALAKIERRKKARKEIEEISKNENHTLVIHYSCESFYNRKDGQTPRITSIAVRNLASGQTESFSIHKVAELTGCPPEQIESRYDELEKKMLGEFFEYLEVHLNYDWVHWNMRDINYGFAAIEHRFKVLKGKPKARLDESRKHDLSRILVALYGKDYIGDPRMAKLMEKNGMKALNFLGGDEEAAAFENKEFVKLHQSTLRKVHIISNICSSVIDGSIKTDANWKDRYGIHPVALLELAVKHWLFSLIGLVVGVWGLLISFSQPSKESPKPDSKSSTVNKNPAGSLPAAVDQSTP
ncbi:MAG: hypothetical protein ACK41W_08835 [Cyanobacteriota bacterium]|jgi:hypothetical protein